MNTKQTLVAITLLMGVGITQQAQGMKQKKKKFTIYYDTPCKIENGDVTPKSSEKLPLERVLFNNTPVIQNEQISTAPVTPHEELPLARVLFPEVPVTLNNDQSGDKMQISPNKPVTLNGDQLSENMQISPEKAVILNEEETLTLSPLMLITPQKSSPRTPMQSPDMK